MLFKEVIVVEGRDDTRRLKEIFPDIETIETNGSAIDKPTLERIKILINQLIGILLLIAACLPLINEAYHRIIKTYLSEHDMIKWALIVVGFLLIKRLISPLISSHKKKKRV